MINFKDPKDQVPSLLAVLGIVLLCGSIVGLFMIKKPSDKSLKAMVTKKVEQYKDLAERAKADAYSADLIIAKQLWTDRVSEITPAALAKVGRLVSDSNLNLVSFRPQKPLDGPALMQLQYNLSVDGTYTSVAALVDKIEKSDAKLAVNSVQYSSSENDSDKVTATIGLLAFHDLVKAQKSTKKDSTTTTTKPAVKS